jgi:hypothetical protein
VRNIEHRDFLEYCAALSPWAAFMTHRAKDAPMLEPLDFAFWRKARMKLNEDAAPAAGPPGSFHTPPASPRNGRPAVLVAPVPETGMRYAKPGERPPSKYAPGEDDGVIARYDAYAAAYWSGKVKHHGR